ncbi:MAG: hypothetical protein JXQ96_09310 [Cyclobacteriaceae bacterium]
MKQFIFHLTLLAVFGSCSEKTISPADDRLGLEYYPLEVGQYRIYDVDEILYSISSFDTLNYELKESVVGTFDNAEGELSYVVYREKRESEVEEWAIDSVWTARKTNNLAISVENNRSIIKMVFPIESEKNWDSNVLNSSSEKVFSYDLTVADTTLASTDFADVVKIIQSDIAENIVNQDERYEIYAQGVGLIIKSGLSLTFCTVDCPDTKTIVSGRKIHQTLKAYGSD